MRLEVYKPKAGAMEEPGDTIIITSHGERNLPWHVLSRTNTSSRDEDNDSSIFTQLNQFLESLPATTQDNIFECYQEAFNVFQSLVGSNASDDVELIARKLRPIIGRMYSIVTEQMFFDWTWRTLVPGLPRDTRTEFSQDMPGTRERTYLVSDYQDLIPMAIAVRMAFPIITEYINTSVEELGKLHRESTAFTLLYESWIYNCKAMARLYEFVDRTVGADRENDSAIMSGIGSQRFIEWILAFLVIRRLINADIRGTANPTVVSTLYHAIETRIRQVINSGMNVKIKKYKEPGGDPDNNMSILEGFRTKEEITTGDLAIFREYINRQRDIALTGAYRSNPLSLVARLQPDISPSLIKACYNNQKARKNKEYVPLQIVAAMWLFADYISPHVAPHINRGNAMTLVAIAQAIFIHRDLDELAVIVGGIYKRTNSDSEMLIGDNVPVLPKAAMQVFNDTYPYLKRGGFDGGTSKQLISLPERTIDDFIKALKSYTVEPAISNELRKHFKNLQITMVNYSPTRNIRVKISDFLIGQASTPKKTINWETLQLNADFDSSSVSY